MIAMRPTRLKTIRVTALSLTLGSLLAGAAVLALPAPARAEDDSFEARFLRGFMETLGLRKDGDATINYQERGPLVIPMARTLPPPESSDAVAANNPAWPKDPDVTRRKEEIERARSSTKGAGEEMDDAQRVMSPSQLTPGPKPRSGTRIAQPDGTKDVGYGYGERLTPSELGYKGGFFGNMFGARDENAAKFTGEPPRASLTEPPPGYQTPSPEQPYGLGAEKPEAPKAGDYQLNKPVSGQ